MRHTVICKGLTGANLFKLLFVGYLFSLGPLSIIIGIFSFFDMGTITLGSTQYTGVQGFFASFVLAIVFPIGMSIIKWIFSVFGTWLYTRFKPITIIYKPTHNKQNIILKDN